MAAANITEAEARAKNMLMAEAEGLAITEESRAELANTLSKLQNIEAIKAQGIAVGGFTKYLGKAVTLIRSLAGPVGVVIGLIAGASYIINKIQSAEEAHQEELRKTSAELFKLMEEGKELEEKVKEILEEEMK